MDPSKLEGLFEQAQQMAQKLHEEMGRRTVDGQSGGGMVVATVNGQGELVKLRIDPKAVDARDVSMLEDLLVAAVNDAQSRAREMVAGEMQKLTGGMPFPMP